MHCLAVGQHQWYDFGVGASPVLVYFSGDWDVHWGITGVLTHSRFPDSLAVLPACFFPGATGASALGRGCGDLRKRSGVGLSGMGVS